MNKLEKMNKKREKRRQKILLEFGYEPLKIFSAEQLNEVREVIEWLESNYILGAGSCWQSMKTDHLKRRESVIGFVESLPYIETVEIVPTENEQYIKDGFVDTIKVKFIKPSIELK